ncbi:hypothetical protein RvY_17585 [Ramazzottius varieornatus]|uniref:Uncharacterized protein n=1 Tax=Ramazzottius varieornatus TaxID=947166 RepID=A0A1D1W4S1_RAMVA|nr:hypothetical protein RvY_17585 [Ramazzottius varieornatus]
MLVGTSEEKGMIREERTPIRPESTFINNRKNQRGTIASSPVHQRHETFSETTEYTIRGLVSTSATNFFIQSHPDRESFSSVDKTSD